MGNFFLILLAGIVIGIALTIYLAVRMSKKKPQQPSTPSSLDIMADRMRTIAHNDEEPRAAIIAKKALKEAGLPLT